MYHYRIPPNVVKFTMGQIKFIKAKIKTSRGLTEEFRMERGTAQGNPLSPLLAALVLSVYLDHINSGNYQNRYKMAGNLFSATGASFSDDTNLFVDSKEKVIVEIIKFKKFLQTVGNELVLDKCEIFTNQ